MTYQPYASFGSRDAWTSAERDLFVRVTTEKTPDRADAIIWIEADHHDRVRRCVELFDRFERKIPIVLSGGVKGNPYRPDADTNPEGGNIPAWEIKPVFMAQGIPENRLIEEGASMNARDQAINVVALAKERGWKKLILVASTWHQMRLFLTFLKQLQLQDALDIELVNQPETRLPLERDIPGRGKNTIEMIHEDLWRITNYIENGSTAPAQEGLAYLDLWPKQFGKANEQVKHIVREIPIM